MGKETAINRLLPQAEVIYLHYSTDNMEEYDLLKYLFREILNLQPKQTYLYIYNLIGILYLLS